MTRLVTQPHARYAQAVLVGAALFLGGCAVGPGYARPKTPTPVSWKGRATAETSSDVAGRWKEVAPHDAEERGRWWEAFADSTLNGLEEQALRSNQTLQGVAAGVLRARAVARITAADWLPSVDASGTYTHALRSLSSFGGVGSINTDTFSTPIDLSYELDLWGRVRRSFEAARAEAQASEAAFRTALLTLTADVATNFVVLRELDAERDILGQTVTLREQALQLVEQRAAAGVVSQVDVARVRTEVASAESELLDVTRRRAEFENALALLCGQTASDFSVARVALAMTPPPIPAGLPSQLLERRPDIAEAERQMAAASARIGIAQAAFFPVVRLTGSGGYVSTELSEVFSWDNHVWSLGPSISVPLFAGGRHVAGVKAAQAQYQEAVANYRQRVLVVFKDVEDALANLQLRAGQSEAQGRALASAREAATLSMARYGQGLVSFLEVVDAERSRLQAERAATQVLSQRLLSTVLLIKALGGSWGPVSAAASAPLP